MTNSIPIEIAAIDHVVLRVRDSVEMVDFYVDVLGCQIDRQRPELGLTQLRAGNCLIDLVTIDGVIGTQGGRGPGPDGHNMDHFCLRLSEFDAVVIIDWLKKNNCDSEPAAPRYGATGTGDSIYLRDPEGNMVELKSPENIE